MKNNFVPGLVLLLFGCLPLPIQGQNSGGHSYYIASYTDVEKARDLLESWEKWSQISSSEEANSKGASPKLTKEGTHCDGTESETLRFIYYTRFASSLEGAKGKRRLYNLSRHLAENLKFYDSKMGRPPIIPIAGDFCLPPTTSPEALLPQFKSDDGLFLWPPQPYHFMCENKTCTPCDKVTNRELKEACNLNKPETAWWSTIPKEDIEVQDLYQSLSSFKSLQLSQKQLNTPDKLEGYPCKVDPNSTLAYSLLLKMSMSSVIGDFQSHASAWGELSLMKSHLQAFKSLNSSKDGLTSMEFCKSDLQVKRHSSREPPTAESELWMKGAYVCGGKTCKPCKVIPLHKGGNQSWNYERGPLYEACKNLAELKEGVKSQEEFNKDIEAKCCEAEKKNSYDGFTDPCYYMNYNESDNIYDGSRSWFNTNYDRWKAMAEASKNSSSNCFSVRNFFTVSMIVFGVNFHEFF